MQLSRYFILTMVSWRIFAIKGGMSIVHILRVFSMGHDFFSKLDSTFSSFASNISVVLSLFTLNFEYVVAETISYHEVCPLFFDQMPGSCSYFTYKVGFENSIFRLRVISMGNVLVYR